MLDCEYPIFPSIWADPSGQREQKPRSTGLTMVIDKGIGLGAFRDMLELSAPHFDICKLGFGTSVLYPPELLKQKVSLAKRHGLHIMPGGTFFEVAIRHSSVAEYMGKIRSLGFNAVEISDGTFPLPIQQRQEAIAAARNAGLIVYTEYGKKEAHYRAQREDLLQTLSSDLAAGASYVIVEARESGTVGVFDGEGKVDDSFVREIAQTAKQQADRLIWEAPQKEQQVSLLLSLGGKVNLGNIASTDVLALEALRRGLRGDTAAIVEEGRSAPCE